MSAWEHEAADLLRAGGAAMSPTAADRERVRARLAEKLGVAAVATASIAAAKKTATAGATKGGVLAALRPMRLPLAIAGGAAIAIALASASPRTTPPAPATPPSEAPRVPLERTEAPRAEAPAPPPPPRTTTTTATATATARDTRPLPRRAPRPAPDPAREARMVAAVDAALRAGDAAGALAAADAHERSFPNGALAEEREGGRAIARCMTGSRASADAFLAAHPRSPMRGRILAACGAKGPR